LISSVYLRPGRVSYESLVVGTSERGRSIDFIPSHSPAPRHFSPRAGVVVRSSSSSCSCRRGVLPRRAAPPAFATRTRRTSTARPGTIATRARRTLIRTSPACARCSARRWRRGRRCGRRAAAATTTLSLRMMGKVTPKPRAFPFRPTGSWTSPAAAARSPSRSATPASRVRSATFCERTYCISPIARFQHLIASPFN